MKSARKITGYRTFSAGDIVADGVGILGYIGFLYGVSKQYLEAKRFMNGYMWMPATKRASRPKVSPETKAALKARADRWVEEYLKPAKVEPAPENPRFNYLVDIFTKWHGSFFYFCATYHCPFPNAISPSFERKFARMTYSGNDTYTLSYMRHTDKWHEVFYDQDVERCFELIAHEPCFLL